MRGCDVVCLLVGAALGTKPRGGTNGAKGWPRVVPHRVEAQCWFAGVAGAVSNARVFCFDVVVVFVVVVVVVVVCVCVFAMARACVSAYCACMFEFVCV